MVNKEELRNKFIKGKTTNNENNIFNDIFNSTDLKTDGGENNSKIDTFGLNENFSNNTISNLTEKIENQGEITEKKGFKFVDKKKDTNLNKTNSNNQNLFNDIDFSSSSNVNLNKDPTIHINQTSNINITFVQNNSSPDNNISSLNDEKKSKGFIFVKKSKPTEETQTSFKADNKDNGILDLNFLDNKIITNNDNNNLLDNQQISYSQSTQNKENKKVNIDDLINQMYITKQPDNSTLSPQTGFQNYYSGMNQQNQIPLNMNQNQMSQYGGGIYPNQNYYNHGNIPTYPNQQNPYQYNPGVYGINSNYSYYQNQQNYKSMFEKDNLKLESEDKGKKKDDKFGFIDDLIQK